MFPLPLQPPDSDQYHSQLPWMIVHRVYSNAISYLSIRDQSVCESSHLERYRCIHVWAWEHTAVCNSIFGVAKFTILTPLSSLFWCKLSFPIVGLKISSLPTFALKSLKRIFVWYLAKLSKTFSNCSRQCLMNHHFSPHLLHAHWKEFRHLPFRIK